MRFAILVALLAWSALASGQPCTTFSDSLQGPPYALMVQGAQDSTLDLRCVIHILHHDSLPGSNLNDDVVQGAWQSLHDDFAATGIGFHLMATMWHNVTENEWAEQFRSGQSCPTWNIGVLNAYALPYYWDPETYCNIWVTPWSCGPNLGWAFVMPNENQADGVWVRTDVFGVEGEHLMPGRDLNRTLTHEMGHYLGLRHIFHETNFCGQVEDDCEQQGDYVCDTPRVKASWSCLNPACPPGLYGYTANNHMDYPPDSCRTTFTLGQVDRMQQHLLNFRESVRMDQCIGDYNGDYIVGTMDVLIALDELTSGGTIAQLLVVLMKYGNLCQ